MRSAMHAASQLPGRGHTRAVIVIDDIDVPIKKSIDTQIDTEIWISILIDIKSSKNCSFYAPVEHYPYHGAATQLTCNGILTGTIGLYQYSGTISKMHKCIITSNPKEPINE